MKYNGRYTVFDSHRIKTYPLSTRSNKVSRSDLLMPDDVIDREIKIEAGLSRRITELAEQIIICRKTGKPVILFTGAHLIKNGMGPLIVDLVEKEMLTLVAGNAATAIHDFELALIGETSENVPNAISEGRFGMAYEFAYMNTALSLGNALDLGYGETLGRMICDPDFQNRVLNKVWREGAPKGFAYPEISVLAACYEKNIPFTVHAGIGVDVLDQHPSFDGAAKGGCSGRDFLIYTNEVTGLTNGGIVLNIGSAVQGPEVFLKAVSMAANAGDVPRDLVTADFDLREYRPEVMADESEPGYYFRDQKSIVTRVPHAFHGEGYYIRGNQLDTVPFLYREITRRL
jgi:hypothetical protein